MNLLQIEPDRDYTAVCIITGQSSRYGDAGQERIVNSETGVEVRIVKQYSFVVCEKEILSWDSVDLFVLVFHLLISHTSFALRTLVEEIMAQT